MARGERARLIWTPQWDGTVSGWTANFINRNIWRLEVRPQVGDPAFEFDDLMQDAYLIYLKICDKYPRVIEEKNFVSLYKVSITNWMHDKALYMKRKRVLHQATDLDVSELYTGRIGELANGGYAAVLLTEMPEELSMALKVLTENPEALLHLPKSKDRQNLNAKLRQILGYGEGFDFVGEIKALFT